MVDFGKLKSLARGLQSVPNVSLTALSTTDTYVKQIHVANNTAVALTFVVQDTGGKVIVPTKSIAANDTFTWSFPEGVLCVAGVKWQASGVGLNGEVVGYSLPN